MTLKFKPQDFFSYPIGLAEHERIHGRAQDIFDNWLSKQQVIYGDEGSCRWNTFQDRPVNPTRKARLICIEEIKKCTHENGQICHYNNHGLSTYTCMSCGKELKPASWREV